MVLTRSDVNPNNIFLSNIDSASPMVKLGDLGNRTGLEQPISIFSDDLSDAGGLQQIPHTTYWV